MADGTNDIASESEFLKAWQLPPIPADLAGAVHPSLRSAAESFARTLGGASGVLGFISELIIAGQRYADAFRFTCHERFGRPWWSPGDNAAGGLRDAVREHYLAGRPTFPGGFPVDCRTVIAGSKPILPNATGGAGTLLGAVLFTGWTAFESLTADLWTAAVNRCPVPFGENAVGGDGTIRVPIASLAGDASDVRGKLGDWLRDRQAVSFMGLDDIQDCYKRTFQLPKGRPSAPLGELFDRYYGRLLVLQLVRNLLAHRAGRVDAKFLRNVRDHDAELAALPVESHLPMSGERVRDLVGPAVDFSLELIAYVSRRVAEHERSTAAGGTGARGGGTTGA